jgi:arsenite methyltransferase
VGCIAGALSVSEYHRGLAVAGFTDISITPTHPVADGMHSAVVRANKPAADSCCGVHACCTPQEHAVDVDVTVTEAKTAGGCGCVSAASNGNAR